MGLCEQQQSNSGFKSWLNRFYLPEEKERCDGGFFFMYLRWRNDTTNILLASTKVSSQRGNLLRIFGRHEYLADL